MYFDAHCHIDTNHFDGDRLATLKRAKEAGVSQMVTVGCDIENAKRALGLAKTHAHVFSTAGIHPHEAGNSENDFDSALTEILKHPKCVAVGECGLDYFYDKSPRQRQREVFSKQIALARSINKPLVIHVRDAWEDCLQMLSTENARDAGGMIHCFSGEWEHAKRALDLGFMISIPGIVTFKKSGALPEVIPKIPDDRLLVETDSPFLAPSPHRGKRNEPAFVVHTLEKVAELRDRSVEEIATLTTTNAKRFYKINQSL